MSGETIAAISTPVAEGGIAIVRISGERAIEIAQKVFKSHRGILIEQMKTYTAAYGRVFDGDVPLDECIALLFKAPKSYTGEDVVELSTHGGIYVMRRLLAVLIKAGARLAEPGEFTKRAFLSGRLDLTSAEAVMDIISARGKAAARAGVAQQSGALFKKVQLIKEELIDIASDISAYIDFPEEDLPQLETPVLRARLSEIADKLDIYINSFEKGRLVLEGVDTVIAGCPNVGKSTLMNLLAGAEKSIVTEIPGTTRDIVEESVTFAGIVLKLADTAGLREGTNVIERIGVERARARIQAAQLVFAVFDASRPLEKEDIELLAAISVQPSIIILNKADLASKIDEEYIRTKNQHVVKISALNGNGIQELEEIVKELTGANSLDASDGFIANDRQLECALRAYEGVSAAVTAIDDGITLDAVSTGVEQALESLAELTGEKAMDETLERVFSKFCIGK